MATLFINRSGYTLGGALVGNQETPVKATRALVPGEAVLNADPLITIHPIDGVCFLGTPVRDWVSMFLHLEAAVQTGAKQWITPDKTPGGDWSHMENPAGNALRPYRAPKPGEPVARAHADQVADAPAGYRPYQAPKLGKAGVTVAQAGKVRGGVDAELAAAGWRPYRDPRKETA